MVLNPKRIREIIFLNAIMQNECNMNAGTKTNLKWMFSNPVYPSESNPLML